MGKPNREYVKSIIFGIEDSLVSTTGLIAGLSVGADSKQIVILGAAVAVAIEALSMGAGEYLSDDAIQEMDGSKKHADSPFVSGTLMFMSYFLAGLLPLLPVVFLEYPTSIYWSILIALCGLFALGYAKGKVLGTKPLHGALKILLVGGAATGLGVIVGLLFKV